MSYKRIVAEQEELRKYNEDREGRLLKLVEKNMRLMQENAEYKQRIQLLTDKLRMINEKLTEITNRIEGY